MSKRSLNVEQIVSRLTRSRSLTNVKPVRHLTGSVNLRETRNRFTEWKSIRRGDRWHFAFEITSSPIEIGGLFTAILGSYRCIFPRMKDEDSTLSFFLSFSSPFVPWIPTHKNRCDGKLRAGKW